MAKAAFDTKKWLPQIPVLAAMYAFYEYYAEVGLAGIKADLEALTFEGLKTRAKEILMGFVSFLIGDAIAANIKDKYLKSVVRSIAYYVGAKQLAGALDKGSTVSRQVETGAYVPESIKAKATTSVRGY